MSGTLTATEWIWKDGDFIKWDEANVHVLSLAVQFASSVFEGIRCYDTPDGPALFRLDAHLRRLLDSCRIYRMDIPYDADQLAEACKAVVRKNGLRSCYVRPTVIRGYGAAGMLPVGSPIETFIPTWPWGAYLGEEGLERGVDVCVSSWQRAEPNTFPAQAKSAANYANAQLIKMEAVANGYVDAIALAPDGRVSEGSGMNLFLVRDGNLITPLVDGSSLLGITRDAVLTIAKDIGVPIREVPVPRETLYIADEMFFVGTAAEVTPIRTVDKVQIGEGKRGPVTHEIQKRFLAAANGTEPDKYCWRTLVQ